MTTIRPLRRDDADAVLRLNAAAVPAAARLDRRELSRLMRMSDFHAVAVQSDGSRAGYALAFCGADACDGEAFAALRSRIAAPFVYVDQIVVDARFRRTGIGRTFYREFALLARNLGMTALCCEVNIVPPNPVSLDFHRRLAFMPIAEIGTPDGRRVVLLGKTV